MSEITYDYAEILQRLSAKFPAEQVRSFPMQTTKKADKNGKWKGKPAFYIDARAVQQRLDETCVWENIFEYDPRYEAGALDMDGKPKPASILCGIRILISRPDGALEWITRWDGADNSDIEGTKGGLSSAMRRSAVNFGIGRYLYDVEAKWQEMKPPTGRATRPAYFVQTPRIPSEFLPEGSAQRAKAAKSADKPEPAQSESKEAEEPTGIKLTAAQTKRFSGAAKGKDRNAVKPIYSAVISGDLKLADAIKKVKALPDESND